MNAFYIFTAYLIGKPPESITFVEGQTIYLTYTFLINRFAVVFKRNDVVIRTDHHMSEIDSICSKTLEIRRITPNDEGEYCLEASGLKSKPTMVIVKRMLVYNLQFTRKRSSSIINNLIFYFNHV